MHRSLFRSRRGAERHFSRFEHLEARRLLSADFRSIDGSGNNLGHPDWGSSGTQLLRAAAPPYADDASAPARAAPHGWFLRSQIRTSGRTPRGGRRSRD